MSRFGPECRCGVGPANVGTIAGSAAYQTCGGLRDCNSARPAKTATELSPDSVAPAGADGVVHAPRCRFQRHLHPTTQDELIGIYIRDTYVKTGQIAFKD